MAEIIPIADEPVVSVPLPYETKHFCLVGVANTAQFPVPPFCVFFATPIESNLVRVFFCEEPRHVSPLGSTDVLLRDNWAIALVDDGGDPLVTEPVIEQIENVQPRPEIVTGLAELPWSVDIRLDRRIVATATYQLILAPQVENAPGTRTTPAAPDDRVDFPGIIVRRPRRAPRSRQVEEDRLDYRYDFFQGFYRLDSKSDYDTHSGVVALKKRIIRRIISTPGGFSHLPDYGVGVRVKEPINATKLADLRSKVRRQVLLEEEVERVDVEVTFTGGVLFIKLDVRTQVGAFRLELERPSDGGEFVVV